MRLKELGNNQTGKITKMTTSQAEIDHGDGTKTTVDLKKNPNALQKDTATGKVKMNKSNSAGNTNKPEAPRPGDEVEVSEKTKSIKRSTNNPMLKLLQGK